MITIVSGQPRSGTSLTMQMLQAAGYPIYFNRLPNSSPANPRGYYELRDNIWKFQDPVDTWKVLDGKFVKVFPDSWQYLRPEKFDYRFIYLDREPVEIAKSNIEMCKMENETWNSGHPELEYSDELVASVAAAREWSLWVLEEYPSIVVPFERLFGLDGQLQIGMFLGSEPWQVDAMQSCVVPSLRHF